MERPKLPVSLGIDNRRSTRHAMDCRVSLTSESNFYVGFTENISEGGLFVSTDDLLPLGTQIQLKFTLPGDSHEIACVGEVRWHRTTDGARGFGVRFLGLSEADGIRIRSFLEDRAPLFHPDQ